MKKKYAFFAILGVSIFGLTACENFQEMFYFGGNSHGPRSDVSTPPPGDTVAHQAIYRYEDYAKNNVYRISATPSVGNPKLLVIPVWISLKERMSEKTFKQPILARMTKPVGEAWLLITLKTAMKQSISRAQ